MKHRPNPHGDNILEDQPQAPLSGGFCLVAEAGTAEITPHNVVKP